jgi:hypothetical protein
MNEQWAEVDRPFKIQMIGGIALSAVCIGLGIAALIADQYYAATACTLTSTLLTAYGTMAAVTRSAFTLVAGRLAKLEGQSAPAP